MQILGVNFCIFHNEKCSYFFKVDQILLSMMMNIVYQIKL